MRQPTPTGQQLGKEYRALTLGEAVARHQNFTEVYLLDRIEWGKPRRHRHRGGCKKAYFKSKVTGPGSTWYGHSSNNEVQAVGTVNQPEAFADGIRAQL